jgi:hypothetical protein
MGVPKMQIPGGVVLCVTVVFLPFGVWCFFKARRYDKAFQEIGL